MRGQQRNPMFGRHKGHTANKFFENPDFYVKVCNWLQFITNEYVVPSFYGFIKPPLITVTKLLRTVTQSPIG